MEWIDVTTLLYFFSSLSQCAAGFAALIGLFAVFRLQANTLTIAEEYTAARNWLCTIRKLSDTQTLPRRDVRTHLERSKDGRPQYSEQANNILLRIDEAEDFDRELVFETSRPLKLWGYIFIFSIGIIPFAELYKGRPGIIAFFIFFAFAIWALFLTRKFVQKCLSF